MTQATRSIASVLPLTDTVTEAPFYDVQIISHSVGRPVDEVAIDQRRQVLGQPVGNGRPEVTGVLGIVCVQQRC
jgi:hypothetical protein